MILHLEKLHALECSICEEQIEIRRVIASDPEKLADFKELTELDHVECEQFKHDAWKAKQARKFRKRKLKRYRDGQPKMAEAWR